MVIRARIGYLSPSSMKTIVPDEVNTVHSEITVQEHLFGAFALAPLTFGPSTSLGDVQVKNFVVLNKF